jgi:hypothetical protein
MSLRKAQVARASTSLNILQQVGASIGTAVLSVLLAGNISDKLPGSSGGIGGSAHVPDAVREKVAGPLADAFGQTFWWAVGLLLLAYVSAFFLPRHKAEAPVEEDDEEFAPVMAGV